ncbi:tetratricopeptide repeat protein [Dolichospermum sp. ST_con]|nr:tetratricopeptide repeat protein [Dolichospermum sp. ST_con]MDD1419250.1 tetratricopeptide repeat protein [Dolichospermum sp. ST_sed1]MDD1424746.1 tetratricopeptide repeat protein [Dolichospermum sp. ST_sed9]MDD1434030.1 tetratricopeptide repeat protein [Dolichospermum sp. ST_sed6]MDD1440420.1 tetratricopeptide repeat protein [Dolichospermum sp. ST_sed3]MDD1446440.1 tetratricopeptide repeat protein [Dolichospermum sp. ST_sed8]MDD1456842.1 tetratricopeptide repeat protein [Dolichospermum sp
MLDQVTAAFERKDYQTAAKLLQQLLVESPENPWVQLYLGRLKEVSGQREEAEKVYRQLLRLTTHSKLISQARKGLQRLEEIKQEEKQRAISKATVSPDNNELGILVLEPINNALKTSAVSNFAQIMQVDPYTARITLPSQNWRVYRMGKVGELAFYGTQLQEAGIPCFWIKIPQIQQIQVFQVKHLSIDNSQIKAVCQNEANQTGSMRFDRSEITDRVVGLLPIFEQVVDVNNRGKLEWKTRTQDYAQFCDLHLPKRRSILRIYDQGYEFQQSLETNQNTIRLNWNNLMNWIEQQLPQINVWSDFNRFAQTVIDQTETLNQIPSHINLFRKENSYWDAAFHLYSGIIFTKNAAVQTSQKNHN